MLFNTHLFILLFLPVALGLCHALAHRADFRLALGALVLCSLVFYGAWNPRHLPLLLGSIAFNFAVARLLLRYRRRALLAFGIAANLALIGAYKYAGFLFDNVSSLFGSAHVLPSVLLPLGISFFTFQQITFLVDTWRGRTGRVGVLDYLQFVTFFPQLIAGPIVHHREMMPQFRRERLLADVGENLAVGLTIFTAGLFKKVVLADSIAPFATPLFDAAHDGVTLTLFEAWCAALAYTLQLYFDFSGYSDMAIGLARLFGITLPMNFDSPYKARSIIDFWRRWHVTLSRFLRDYLYVPLGGNRRGRLRRQANLLATMVLGGLWHGAGWTFLLWGALHGVYLVVNRLWRERSVLRSSERPSRCARSIHAACARTLTLLAVIVAWVVFRAESVATAGSVLASMAGLNGLSLPAAASPLFADLSSTGGSSFVTFDGPFANGLVDPGAALGWIAALAAVALLLPNTQQWMSGFRPVLDVDATPGQDAALARHVTPDRGAPAAPGPPDDAGRERDLFAFPLWRPSLPWALLVAALALFALLQLSSVSEFLYFRF